MIIALKILYYDYANWLLLRHMRNFTYDLTEVAFWLLQDALERWTYFSCQIFIWDLMKILDYFFQALHLSSKNRQTSNQSSFNSKHSHLYVHHLDSFSRACRRADCRTQYVKPIKSYNSNPSYRANSTWCAYTQCIPLCIRSFQTIGNVQNVGRWAQFTPIQEVFEALCKIYSDFNANQVWSYRFLVQISAPCFQKRVGIVYSEFHTVERVR